jgi:TetR/AcrR family transcriptional regulator, transcriptional repressor for nem operon
MRVSKEKAAQNRQQIVTAAARLFRERGIGAAGVDSITQEAGLTHGGLYSQFGSKEAIAAEAIRFALTRSRSAWQRVVDGNPGEEALAIIVGRYLSAAHRDAPGHGCVVATLGAELARQPAQVRKAFTNELKEGFDFLAALMPGDTAASRYDSAIMTFASMAGAVMLARAMIDEALSDRVLRVVAEGVLDRRKRRRPAHARASRSARA